MAAAAFDTADELAAFFADFAEDAIIHTAAGDFPVTGIPDVLADNMRPGGVSDSNTSPFISARAEFTIQEFQFLTTAEQAAPASLEDTLEITTGNHVGHYRIKDLNRDGGLCRILLNRL